MFVARPLPTPSEADPGNGRPQFIDTAGFAYVPDVIAARRAAEARDLSVALTPAPVPPTGDRLDAVVAGLEELERVARRALWAGREPEREPGAHFIAGIKVRTRLQELVDEVAALRAADEAPRPDAVRDRTELLSVPAGVLLGLADLLPIIRHALHSAHRLTRHR